MKSVEGRKEGKEEEINREDIRPVKIESERVKSQSVRTGIVLKNCVSEPAKEKRKIERVKENTQ